MSALHKAEITEIFTRWLERYAPPASIRENSRAQQDEVDALLSVLLRSAPRGEAGPWVRQALDRMEYRMKTRAWPTKAELADVCSKLSQEKARDAVDLSGQDLSPIAINARRMRAGEPVGEGWLYGRNAVELIACGQVDRETMERYRSAAFLSKRKLRGEEDARAWEDAAKAQHEAAKVVYRQRNDEAARRDVGVPDKSTPVPKGYAA